MAPCLSATGEPRGGHNTTALLPLITYPAAQGAFDQEVLVTRVELGGADGLEVRLQQALAQRRHCPHNREQDKGMSLALKLQLDWNMCWPKYSALNL